MNAQAEVASAAGHAAGSFAQLYKGVGVSTLNPGKEIIIGFDVPLQQTRSGFGIFTGDASAGSGPVDHQHGYVA